VAREAVARLHHGWGRVPPAARRRWWTILLGGAAACALLTLTLVAATRRAEAAGLLAWEHDFLRGLDAQSLLSFNLAMWLEAFANGFVLWLVVLYAAGASAWAHRPMRAVTLLTGYTLMYLLIIAGWLAWGRERPTLIAEGIGSPGRSLSSFPSGHTVQGVVAHGTLAWLWIRSTRSRAERALVVLLLLALTAVVMVSRLRLGAHWPSDVVGGLVIGAAWLAVMVAALQIE